MKNPSQINPLIEESHTPDDTIYNIQAALEFIADSLAAVELDVGLSKSTAHGARSLISCCVAALDSVKLARFPN